MQIDSLCIQMRFLTNFYARRNMCIHDGIELFKIDMVFPNLRNFHSATDVDAYHVENDFILNRNYRSDRIACTCLHIQHDTDFAPRKNLIVAPRLYLRNDRRLYGIRIDLCLIEFSMYFHTHRIFAI